MKLRRPLAGPSDLTILLISLQNQASADEDAYVVVANQQVYIGGKDPFLAEEGHFPAEKTCSTRGRGWRCRGLVSTIAA